VKIPTLYTLDVGYTAAMQITVFGATGKVGTLVTEEALRRGYTVVAFVHQHAPASPSNKLIIRKGDVHNAADVARALVGSQAMVSCLGSWGTPRRTVLSNATLSLIPAMKAAGVRRVVTLTGIGVRKKPSALYRFLLHAGTITPAGKVFWDGQEHVRLLAESGLDWTTVCSPIMNNSGGPGYRLSRRLGWPLVTIARRSVAAALLDQIEATDYLQSTAVIHRK